MGFTLAVSHKKKSEAGILVRGLRQTLRSVSSIYALAFITVLLVTSGCGGDASPSGPSVARNIQEGKAVEVSRDVTLHVILVVDTHAAGSLNGALEQDLDYMTTLVDSIVTSTGMQVDKQVLSGSRATKFMLEQTLDTFSVEPDDAILFYFSGHGGRTQETGSQWPDMYLHNAFALNLKEVFDRLSSKGARLLLALGDSCNGLLDEASETEAVSFTAFRGRVEGYRKLFLEKRAAIIASSSVAGELSYMQPRGSLFTRQFLQVLSTEVSTPEPDWKELMDAVTQQIRVAGVEQHPQYLMY